MNATSFLCLRFFLGCAGKQKTGNKNNNMALKNSFYSDMKYKALVR
jgi:hypothetical protein